jgi:hypothetical protein
MNLFKFAGLLFLMLFGYMVLSIGVYAQKESYRNELVSTKDTVVFQRDTVRRKYFLLRDRLLNEK